jgi:hypothetical protein
MNFGIVDNIRKLVHSVLQVNPQPSQYNATTYFPMAQTSQYVVPTYVPISSEGIQPQVEAFTLPQDSVNDTAQDVLEVRALIDAPLINGKCNDGYRSVNGRCRQVFGRRRRRR